MVKNLYKKLRRGRSSRSSFEPKGRRPEDPVQYMSETVNLYEATEGACMACIEPCPRTMCRYHIHSDARKLQIMKRVESETTCSLKLANRGGMTLEEIGSIMGLTRERVRQIETRGKTRLRHILEKEGYSKELLVHFVVGCKYS